MDHATIGTKGSVPEKQRLVDKVVKSVFEDNGLLHLLVLTVMVRGRFERALENNGITNNQRNRLSPKPFFSSLGLSA